MDELELTDDSELHELYLTTPPSRLFLKTAAPGALSMLASALYDVLDGIIVGQFLGSTAFAAVNLAMPFVIVVFAVGDLVGVGSSVPIAIALGAGDDERANTVFTCAVLGIFFLGAALGATLWVWSPAILAAMGARGVLAEQAVTFLRVYAATVPLTAEMFAFDNYLRICGRIHGSLALNIFMGVFGAVVEYCLVRYAQLGVFGAALGYSLAMSVSAIIAIVPFALRRYKLRFVRPQVTLDIVRVIMTAGMPAFLNNIASRVTAVLLNAALLAQGGEDAVAVYGALMYVGDAVYPLLYGTCDALQPAVGYNLGADRTDRVVALEKHIFTSCAVISMGLAALMLAFPTELTYLFMADASESIIALAGPAFRLFSIAYFVRWIPMATQSLYTAIEQSKPASAFSLFEALIAPVAFLLLLQPLGITGLWLNLPAATIASTVVALAMLVHLRGDMDGK